MLGRRCRTDLPIVAAGQPGWVSPMCARKLLGPLRTGQPQDTLVADPPTCCSVRAVSQMPARGSSTVISEATVAAEFVDGLLHHARRLQVMGQHPDRSAVAARVDLKIASCSGEVDNRELGVPGEYLPNQGVLHLAPLLVVRERNSRRSPLLHTGRHDLEHSVNSNQCKGACM